MDKTVVGVLGAMAALAATQAHAAPAGVAPLESAMQASSYADLLTPIPNAADVLAAMPAPEPIAAPAVEPVQYYHHHHHHHWRHRYWRHHRWYYR